MANGRPRCEIDDDLRAHGALVELRPWDKKGAPTYPVHINIGWGNRVWSQVCTGKWLESPDGRYECRGQEHVDARFKWDEDNGEIVPGTFSTEHPPGTQGEFQREYDHKMRWLTCEWEDDGEDHEGMIYNPYSRRWSFLGLGGRKKR